MSQGESDDIMFNLELQLEEDKVEHLIIRENDDIDIVVTEFCESRNYDENIRSVIMNQIVSALDQNIEDCK